jgi:flagellar basal body-associated protein FliL
MFKRKPIYIILLILFTLLLAADVTAYCLTANASSGMPARPDGAMPQTSGGAMPQTSDGAMPQTSDGTMPQMGDGTMPQMGDGTMPQVSRDSGSWGNFDPSQMQGGFPGSTAVSAFASFIKSWWIPIGALCVLADALCILMLICISKKCRQAGGETGGGETEPEAPKARKPQVSGYEKRRRKQRRTIRAVAVILSAVFALAVVYGVAGAIYEKQLKAQSAATIVSAEAVSAGMNTDISGTGTLTDAEAEEVTVPNGVEIARVTW